MLLKSFIFSILSVWWVIAYGAKEIADADSRIVGGNLTTISSVPYIVQILKKGNFACGGSLVAPNFVICAAHCFQDKSPADITVVAGATKLTDTGIRRKVLKLLMPATWNPDTMHMDVAVLKLVSPITDDTTKTIELHDGDIPAGKLVQVSGWGLTSEGGSLSQQLQIVKFPVIDKKKCERQFKGIISLSYTMFCAGVPGSQDSCSGDSGGPVVADGKLCGIVSFGVGCARKGYPGVYTSIKNSSTFIQNCLKL